MNSQINLFDGSKKFVIDKPIRLISLFSGIDAQALGLEYLGIPFEHYRTCEWAVKSIQALKDAHFGDDNTDYSQGLRDEHIYEQLCKWGISANYNEPMTPEQIKRLGVTKQRQIFSNIVATRNMVNIQQVHAEDLGIEETDKYCYVMTYSFPCQDLSLAGKGAGMEKGSGTQSGMLWEVERILEECKELPQVLLMENVPEVIGINNIKHFAKWLEKLESLGYHCYWKVLNAKDYGVPQNRERCFMVSIWGDYYYEFPQPIKLEHRLKDLLEDNVDEKYYLSDKALIGKLTTNFSTSKLENVLPKDGICPTLLARDYKDPKCYLEPVICASRGRNPENPNSRKSGEHTEQRIEVNPNGCSNTLTTVQKDNYVLEPNLKQQLCDCLGVVIKIGNYSPSGHNASSIVDSNGIAPTVMENHGTVTATNVLKSNNKRLKQLVGYRIRKLTPKECFRLMGVRDEDYEKIAKNQSNASLYHLAGDSIVVDVLMAIFKQMLPK